MVLKEFIATFEFLNLIWGKRQLFFNPITFRGKDILI